MIVVKEIMKINDVSLYISAVRRSQYPTDGKKEFLLVGRSNVGKSSFINTLINRKNFARTSSRPGKTQTLNFYDINNQFYLVDVPGYGFAKVQKSLKKKFGMIIEEYLESREELQMVFMLVDFRHRPTDDDVLMYNYLKHYNYFYDIKNNKIITAKDALKTIFNSDSELRQHGLLTFEEINKADEVCVQVKGDRINEIFDTCIIQGSKAR